MRPNLTVNLGLRYEFVSVPTEVNGKISNLRNVTDPALTVGGQWYANPSLKNFAPRVGLAWDPFSSGKTSIRAGFGLFDDEILPKYYFFSGSLNPPFTQRSSVVNPAFPNLLSKFDPNHILYQLQTTNYNLQNPYALQFNLNIQRSLPGDWVVSAGYSGSRGVHLLRIGDANLAPFTIVGGMRRRRDVPDYCSVASTRTTSSEITRGRPTNSNVSPYNSTWFPLAKPNRSKFAERLTWL